MTVNKTPRRKGQIAVQTALWAISVFGGTTLLAKISIGSPGFLLYTS